MKKALTSFSGTVKQFKLYLKNFELKNYFGRRSDFYRGKYYHKGFNKLK